MLTQYDTVIKNTLQIILNIELSDLTWDQATLPVVNGGLGVRLATDLALPAFLSSVAGSTSLVLQLLPSRFHASSGLYEPVYAAASAEWMSRCNSTTFPDADMNGVQNVWDSGLVEVK